MSEKKRINWLLILQGWAMLWVVIGHAFLGKPGEGPEWETSLFHFAYSFHMPLFMLVSGWLFYLTRLNAYKTSFGGQILVNSEEVKVNRWTFWRIVKDKALRLLLPGLVFSILSFAIKIAFPGEMSRQAGLSISEITHSYLYPYDNPMRELWFIVTLFWLMMLVPVWKVLLKNEWTIWVGVLVIIVLHFFHPVTDFLCIGRVFSYAVWFYLGIVISKEDYVDKYLTKQPWLTLLIGVLIYLGGTYTHSFITTIGGITLSFGLALILDKYIPKTFFTFRDYTYQIFLIGIFAQMFVKIMYKHISMPYVGTYILCILLGVYIPVLVSKVLEWINWKPLLVCVGLKSVKK